MAAQDYDINHQDVTMNQLGLRVNRLDSEVESMRGEINEIKTITASSATVTEALRGDMKILFGKMDRMTEASGGVAATRGMVPVTYVTWGLGLMVSLTSIGITVLGIGAAIVIWVQSSGDNLILKDVDAQSAIQENLSKEFERHAEWKENWLVEWGEIKTDIEQLKRENQNTVGG